MKKFVAGFVAAILLTSSFLFVYADDIKEYVCTKVKYDILVDGEVYMDDKLPALVYEGNTYLPVRNFCNLLGADVEWNAQLSRVEIGKQNVTPEKISTPSLTDNGIPIYNIDDINYVGLEDIHYIYSSFDDGYGFLFRDESNKKTATLISGKTHEALITFDISNAVEYMGRTCITLSFYQKNILPYLNKDI
ncbi:stalk domain-containing protein [Vallitalea guaymasensis]|uniref:Copper amine oxidase-like N-terminal domain-containing protein n=1 Tax=Vallitalea guaymasensis TaxID=1185412 RepID=A0A8J8SCG0_9FIRM|nr:stalk domain-containing protein [Vallitalea guaymasensis]QUH29634.1 hypothetical protein HYG85_12245 [Vallitalea guaymasensis]